MANFRAEDSHLLGSSRSSSDMEREDHETKAYLSARSSPNFLLRSHCDGHPQSMSRLQRLRSCGVSVKQLRLFIVLLAIGLVTFCLYSIEHRPVGALSHSRPESVSSSYKWLKGKVWKDPPRWKKPEGFKIVALVFYGRPRYVNVLDCYLKKNLVSNGGYLDEVHFAVNTKRADDVQWLHDLVRGEPLYKTLAKSHSDGEYEWIWREHATDPNTMYIKIDDDMVFVDDDAIPRMVQTLQNHPEAHDVAANIVNSPLAHWLHYHTDAVLPYLPDPHPPAFTNDTPSWRPSLLPRYPLAPTEPYTLYQRPEDGFPVNTPGGPPHAGHRWLPLGRRPANLAVTPIAAGPEYAPFGTELFQWSMAAQQHYSLFEHLEQGDLSPYWFGNGEGIWNMQYQRYNLNFLAIWGSSVTMMEVGYDDEYRLTEVIPRELKRPLLVDSHAIVAHFGFRTQSEMDATDVLERYRAYANERVCGAHNQRARLPEQFLWSQAREEAARAAAQAQRRKQAEDEARQKVEAERVEKQKKEQEQREQKQKEEQAKQAEARRKEEEQAKQAEARKQTEEQAKQAEVQKQKETLGQIGAQ